MIRQVAPCKRGTIMHGERQTGRQVVRAFDVALAVNALELPCMQSTTCLRATHWHWPLILMPPEFSLRGHGLILLVPAARVQGAGLNAFESEIQSARVQ